MSKVSRYIRLQVLRWHRRVGVALALLVILLSSTGILLNHTEELQLDQQPVKQQWLLSLYGVSRPELVFYRTGNQWISSDGSHLFLQEREVGYCDGGLNGAVTRNNILVALCGEQLVLLSKEGELIERIGTVQGFPQGIAALAVNGDALLLKQGGQTLQFSVDSLTATVVDANVAMSVSWSYPQQPPVALQGAVQMQSLQGGIHWERLLLDIHSGRILGEVLGDKSVWVMDIAAIFFMILATSGVWVWLTKPGRFRRQQGQ